MSTATSISEMQHDSSAHLKQVVTGVDLIEEIAKELNRNDIASSDQNFDALAGKAWLYVYSTNQMLASATHTLSYKRFVMKYMDEEIFASALSGSDEDAAWRIGETFYEECVDLWSKVELAVALDEIRGEI